MMQRQGFTVNTDEISGSTGMKSMSIAVVGSGGAGAITTGTLLLEAAAIQGCYGILTRSVGPQIRGGEAAALVRVGNAPIDCVGDSFDILLAMDWNNVDRFAAEIPLTRDSLIIADPEQGDIPEAIAGSGAEICELPIDALAKEIKKGRTNMIALGIIAEITGLSPDSVAAVLRKQLLKKGEQALQSSIDTVQLGRQAAAGMAKRILPDCGADSGKRWLITGNHATGYGALRGGIRFVAAYPITPATEVLEWLASGLAKTGGRLVQAEDELASINMAIGASFGGVPSLTATSGPGLSLMMESLGLAVSSETPVVIIDVMRVGPSTGIATKAEQSDLNIAVYGFHGDAPHVVVAPTSVGDCLFTSQWAVYLAEAMQVPTIVLTDQYLGQTKSIISPPAAVSYRAERLVADQPSENYERYAITESGISPMAIPGTAGGQYTADGLEHSTVGTPSTRAEDHELQMDKRLRKINTFDYGDHWADIEGDGKLAIITWGSTTGAIREALKNHKPNGKDNIKLIAMRLISPAQPEKFARAMAGVEKLLVVEQSHSAQLYRFLRAHYELPAVAEVYHRAGPLLFRPGEILDKIKQWSKT
jgi:2-oxoglutarate ferredoxin oxidoreductase subunit alpha